MKYLLVLCFSLNVFAEIIDTRVQTMRMQLLVPATLESITFDSRVGGVPPPPSMPRPKAVHRMQFRVEVAAKRCLDPSFYDIVAVDKGSEVELAIVYNDRTRRACMTPPSGDWMQQLSGVVITKNVVDLRRGSTFKLMNPLFVKRLPPRP